MLRKRNTFGLLFCTLMALGSCEEPKEKPALNFQERTDRTGSANRNLSEAFKERWYNGLAEVTSFSLSQERYGEIREGHAVQIFVTEDFLPEQQVKSNNNTQDNISVLKYNGVKKFLTGIYPYSIMTSAFSPLPVKTHALKVSHSTQEWCGQAYMQLNNKEQFLITSHSYFAKEADQQVRLEKAWLEDEFWSLIRIDPGELPTGEIEAIPSFEYLRLRHKPITTYKADALLKKRDSISIYQIKYPDIKRELTIYFKSQFPFEIEKWEETTGDIASSGLKTTATRLKRLQTAYWQKNSNSDGFLRDSLGLPSYQIVKAVEVETSN